jgi:hypothetical protein
MSTFETRKTSAWHKLLKKETEEGILSARNTFLKGGWVLKTPK